METTLGWIAVGIGAVGAAVGAVAGRRDGGRGAPGDWTLAAFVVVGTLVLFLTTFLSEPPFALGQRLGYGILIGGLLGALAGVWAARMPEGASWASGVAAAGLSSLALFGVGLVLLIFGGYPQPALGGFVIGAAAAAVIFRLSSPATNGSPARTDLWALTATALGATALLATFRYEATIDRSWWRAPLIVLSAAIVAQVASAAASRDRRNFALPALLSAVVTLGLAAVFAWKLFPDWSLFWVAAIGVGTFALVAWLAGSAPGSSPAAAVAVLAVVALATVGFRTLGGFGIGIGMLAAWSVLLPAVASASRERDELGPGHGSPGPSYAAGALVLAMFIGIGVLLLRLFMESYTKELRGLDLRAHYTFVALTLGAVFPFILASFAPDLVQRGAVSRAANAAAAGIFAAAAPLLVLVLWGFRATLGFFAGSIAAEVFILFIYTGAVDARARGFVRSALLVLVAQIAAVQFAGLLGPAAQMPRLTRIVILAAAVVVGLLWAGIWSLVARRTAKEG